MPQNHWSVMNNNKNSICSFESTYIQYQCQAIDVIHRFDENDVGLLDVDQNGYLFIWIGFSYRNHLSRCNYITQFTNGCAIDYRVTYVLPQRLWLMLLAAQWLVFRHRAPLRIVLFWARIPRTKSNRNLTLWDWQMFHLVSFERLCQPLNSMVLPMNQYCVYAIHQFPFSSWICKSNEIVSKLQRG